MLTFDLTLDRFMGETGAKISKDFRGCWRFDFPNGWSVVGGETMSLGDTLDYALTLCFDHLSIPPAEDDHA